MRERRMPRQQSPSGVAACASVGSVPRQMVSVQSPRRVVLQVQRFLSGRASGWIQISRIFHHQAGESLLAGRGPRLKETRPESTEVLLGFDRVKANRLGWNRAARKPASMNITI